MSRPYDITLFGATGFTGLLVAEYLAQSAAASPMRWAIAGRNAEKLAEVARAVADLAPGLPPPAQVLADVDDPAALAAMARDTRVLITTVGPYLRYGEQVLAACVEAGTHYVDLTGEPQFVDASRARHHAKAAADGTRIVHCCGFDSIPHDLGVLYTLQQFRARFGDEAFDRADLVVRGFVEASGSFSGGTWNSAIEQFSRAREYLRNRPRGGGDPRVRKLPARLYREQRLDRWACPMPTIDPMVVRQSARLRGDYGHSFAYGHYLLADNLLPVVAGATGVAAVFALAQLPPAARLLSRLRPGGEGPSREKRERSWFRVLFIAQADQHEITCSVEGGDPGYDETAKMLAESALCLAFDKDLPPHAGVVTPAAGMGEPLLRRLQAAGLRFSVVR